MIKKILETLVIGAVLEVISRIVIHEAEHVMEEIKKDKTEMKAEEVNEIGTVEMYQNELRYAVQA